MMRFRHVLSLLAISFWQLTPASVLVDAQATDEEAAVFFNGQEVDVAYQNQLQEWQDFITSTDTDTSSMDGYWEWVIIRINGVEGLEAADMNTQADAVVEIQALTPSEPPVEFHNDNVLSRFVFDAQTDNDNPVWYELGFVAFQRGSVTELQVLLKEEDFMTDDQILIDQTTLLPTDYDTWTDYSLQESPYTLNISLRRSVTPLFSSQDQTDMGLTEELFDLEDAGTKASLVYKNTPGNDKAVLYFPGRADSFAHPHVLEMYESRGYDFYSLDPRYCGRSRRFMTDTQYGHWIDDFDLYKEEIDMTIDFMKKNAAGNNYSSIVAHCHSTGAIVALNYALQLQEQNLPEPFDAYILNGPFFDWGHVGGMMKELILENAGMLEWVMQNPRTASGLNIRHTRSWILYRFDLDWKPIVEAHVNSGWAQAVTDVQRKITSRDTPIVDMSRPVLLIASLGDPTLLASESQERMPHVAANYSTVILEYNSHDVTYSFTKELNDDAIAAMSSFLDDNNLGGDRLGPKPAEEPADAADEGFVTTSRCRDVPEEEATEAPSAAAVAATPRCNDAVSATNPANEPSSAATTTRFGELASLFMATLVVLAGC